jgi:hypothetical protein
LTALVLENHSFSASLVFVPLSKKIIKYYLEINHNQRNGMTLVCQNLLSSFKINLWIGTLQNSSYFFLSCCLSQQDKSGLLSLAFFNCRILLTQLDVIKHLPLNLNASFGKSLYLEKWLLCIHIYLDLWLFYFCLF